MFEHLVFWHWLALAVILLIFEVITGSGFLLWIGVSAACVGVIFWLLPDMSWMTQFLLFALLAIVTALGWWLHLRRRPVPAARPTLNQRGTQYIGRVFTLDEAIVNGVGSIHVDDTRWRVHCTDLPAGARVRITGVDGVILLGEEVR